MAAPLCPAADTKRLQGAQIARLRYVNWATRMNHGLLQMRQGRIGAQGLITWKVRKPDSAREGSHPFN